jgi:fatty acid desaturase
VLLSQLERVLPGLDPQALRGAPLDHERIWRRLDLEEPRPGEVTLEARIADALAPHRNAVAALGLVVFTAGVLVVWGLAPWAFERLRASGHGGLAVLVPMACGLIVHGLFVLIVHEATHGNVFGHAVDAWLGNVALGALVLPFMAESYQHTHRVHHKLTNKQGDPGWTPFRQRLFTRSRFLYALYELVPIVNNIDRLREKCPRDPRKVLVAWVGAAIVLALARPPVAFVALLYVGLNIVNAVRVWTEHFGRWRGRASNLYACPFGFGIGNHALHHETPKIPALALAIGVAVREKDASMLTAPYHVCFTSDYRPFRTFQPDFDGSNV